MFFFCSHAHLTSSYIRTTKWTCLRPKKQKKTSHSPRRHDSTPPTPHPPQPQPLFQPLHDLPSPLFPPPPPHPPPPPPQAWEESDPKYISNSDEVKLRPFTTKVHKVDTCVSYKAD